MQLNLENGPSFDWIADKLVLRNGSILVKPIAGQIVWWNTVSYDNKLARAVRPVLLMVSTHSNHVPRDVEDPVKELSHFEMGTYF